LRLAPAGSHQIWSCLAASHVLVLQDLGQHEEALACAQRNLSEAEALLGEIPGQLQLVLSLAEAQLGREGAAARADAALAQLTAAEVTGIRLGFAHEVRARVALLQLDEPAFERHAELCRVAYCAYKNPALVAKYQRLRQSAQSRIAPREKHSDTPDSLNSSSSSRIIAALESCRTSPQRAQLALTVLLHKSGASAGFLFTVSPDGPECSARIGDLVLAHDLLPRVQNYLNEQLEGAEITRTDSVAEAGVSEWTMASGQRFRPVLLSHNLEGSLSISGLAVLAVPSEGRFNYPAQLAPAISRVLANSGDSSLLVVID
jgi:hypothetical protein